MRTQQSWDEFIKTGKIEDYLNFIEKKQISNITSKPTISKEINKMGDSPYAGFSSNNGNDIEHDSYR